MREEELLNILEEGESFMKATNTEKPGQAVSHSKYGLKYTVAFGLCLFVCILAQGFLFLQSQAENVYETLYSDFRVFAVLDGNVPEKKANELKDDISNIQGVLSAEYDSKRDNLEFLKSYDSKMANSAMLFGENPMPETITLQVSPEILPQLDSWLKKNLVETNAKYLSEIHYKPEHLFSILQAGFYKTLISVVLSLAMVLLVLSAIVMEVKIMTEKRKTEISGKETLMFLLVSVGSAVLSFGLFFVFTYPLKFLSPLWWTLLQFKAQFFVIISSCILGWMLLRWKEL
jgi:FtsX extracellular domain